VSFLLTCVAWTGLGSAIVLLFARPLSELWNEFAAIPILLISVPCLIGGFTLGIYEWFSDRHLSRGIVGASVIACGLPIVAIGAALLWRALVNAL
jgi:hypothetical protein